MVWPVAALALLALGFVIAYGSVVQARLEAALAHSPEPLRDSGSDAAAAEAAR